MATVDILFEGYAHQRVAGTVGLITDGDQIIVVDPGMVPTRSAILDALRARGVEPSAVTDIVLSHHHPDHTMSIALFPEVPVHDVWATYHRDLWTSRPAEGFRVSPSVRLIETPGHTPQDITTLVDTPDGVVAFTHLWWHQDARDDPRATDPELLHTHRRRVIELAALIVPGHGAPFPALHAFE